MGYRHKIGILDKAKHELIKGMTHEQLQEWYGDEYVPCYEITKEVYCLGKYNDLSYLNPHRSCVFENKETEAEFSEDHEFYFINKDGLKAIINSYHLKNAEYFKDLMSGKEDVVSHLKSKLDEWENSFDLKPYSLEGENLISSWKYEYAIFELVRIYKSINWETQFVTITGW